ncbi:endoribonuclease [Sulfodiicoccus acidiphilus]|uniref:Endoribonuclease n=1 Tax=Sulfodiicoccus acidiphilus TaxID=1670455 RepID=A0A830H212_9CREN|nr:endoribonuclease [Sulfodiicoccus acidiphilus]
MQGMAKGGPYSHAVVYGGVVFLSGMTGQDPSRETSFAEQFRNACEKVRRALSEAGSSMEKVLKVTVYLSDPSFFSEMNAIFREYFGAPARTTVVCSFPDPRVKVEVDVVAAL